tara:strand:- start:93 stop:791 length:699 start_codon:yes stop_codon:yes gene_type:complete
MAQINDLIDAYKLGALTGLDTSYGGGRDINLKDPLVYDTYSVEDVPLPEGTEIIVEGSPLNRKKIVVQTDQPTGFGKFLAGLRDLVSGNKYDYDRQDRIPLEEYQQKEILKQKRRADLGGDALPSPEQTRKRIESQRVQDAYLFEQLNKLNDYELNRFLTAFPQYEKIVNDATWRRVMQAQYERPDLLQQRMEKARNNYVGALLTRSQALANIANATSRGLERYSGLRNVAG